MGSLGFQLVPVIPPPFSLNSPRGFMFFSLHISKWTFFMYSKVTSSSIVWKKYCLFFRHILLIFYAFISLLSQLEW